MTFSRLLNYKVMLITSEPEIPRPCAQVPWGTTEYSHEYSQNIHMNPLEYFRFLRETFDA